MCPYPKCFIVVSLKEILYYFYLFLIDSFFCHPIYSLVRGLGGQVDIQDHWLADHKPNTTVVSLHLGLLVIKLLSMIFELVFENWIKYISSALIGSFFSTSMKLTLKKLYYWQAWYSPYQLLLFLDTYQRLGEEEEGLHWLICSICRDFFPTIGLVVTVTIYNINVAEKLLKVTINIKNHVFRTHHIHQNKLLQVSLLCNTNFKTSNIWNIIGIKFNLCLEPKSEPKKWTQKGVLSI